MTIEYLDAKRVQGQLGSAGSAELDGTNDYIDLGGSATTYNFLTAGSFSIACWIKITPAHDKILFDNMNDKTPSTNKGITYIIEGAGGSTYQITMKFSDGSSSSSLVTTAVWGDTNWQHFCSTYDGTTMKIYRNGTQVASGSITSNTEDQSYVPRIGWGTDGAKGKLAGNIDDFLITNDVLSATEISDLQTTAVSDVSPTISNQQVHYKFSENFNDSSGNSRNATATGSEISTSVYKFPKPDDKATLIDSATWESPAVASTGFNLGSTEAITLRLDTGNPILGKPVTSITYTLGDSSSPTGTSNVYIYNGTTLKATADETLDDSTIGSSNTQVTFNFTGNTYNMVNGDYIALLRNSGGSGTWRLMRTGQDVTCSNALIFSGTVSGGAPYISDGSTSNYCFGNANIKSVTSKLPENTIFNETDTRILYFLQSSEWKRSNPLINGFGVVSTDPFTSGSTATTNNGWTIVNTDNTTSTSVGQSQSFFIDKSAGKLYWNGKTGADNSGSQAYYDLGGSMASTWILQFKLKMEGRSDNDSSSLITAFGLKSNTDAQGSADGSGGTYSPVQNYARFMFNSQSGASQLRGGVSDACGDLWGCDSTNSNGTPNITGIDGTKTWYCQIKKNSDYSITFTAGTDAFGGTTNGATATTTGTLDTSDLRYFFVETVSLSNSQSNRHHGYISDLKFANGVTSF